MRTVHVDALHPTDDLGNQDTSQTLQVERVDVWPTLDALDRYQETEVSLDNVTGRETAPPHFTTHLHTHVFRYINPDTGDWIEVEQIDELAIIDPQDRYQETSLTLFHPDTQADAGDPDISDTANGIDPPWRLDPFQNIVNYGSSNWVVVGFLISQTDTIEQPTGGTDPPPRGGNLIKTQGMSVGWATSLSFNTSSGSLLSGDTSTAITSGLSWSYAGGGSDAQSVPPNTLTSYLGSKFDDIIESTATPRYTGYSRSNGSHPFFQTLSATMRVYGIPADGPWVEAGVQVVEALTVTTDQIQNPPAGVGIFGCGTILQTRTFDFSTITATYNGTPYDPVAMLIGGQLAQVLLKKREPTI